MMRTVPEPSALAPTGNLSGLFVDLVVPLDTNGSILERDLIVHIQHMARAHTVNGVVILGSAAEYNRFDAAERRRLIEISTASVPEGFPCGIGIHATDPASAVAEIAMAAEAGGGGGCLFVPEGSNAGDFVTTVAAESELFLLVDLGARQGSNLDLETLAAAASPERVEGIRTPTTDPDALGQERSILEGRASLVGAADGSSVISQLEAHVDSVMLSASNAFPELWGRCVAAALEGDWDRAHSTYEEKLIPLCAAMDVLGAARHTLAIKSILSLLTVFSGATTRDDASPANDEELQKMRNYLVGAGLMLG